MQVGSKGKGKGHAKSHGKSHGKSHKGLSGLFHLTFNQGVMGSNPIGLTNFPIGCINCEGCAVTNPTVRMS